MSNQQKNKMKTKHTQGDLSINYGPRPSRLMENFSSHNFAHSIGRFKGIAETFGFAVGDTKEKAEANAKLIASAPELLDALKKVLEFVPKMEQLATWQKAEQAIKKATE